MTPHYTKIEDIKCPFCKGRAEIVKTVDSDKSTSVEMLCDAERECCGVAIGIGAFGSGVKPECIDNTILEIFNCFPKEPAATKE